ncbi:4Fe-4S binding domain protein, partial [Vibrio parahaemolyticus V-223/04]
RYGPFK